METDSTGEKMMAGSSSAIEFGPAFSGPRPITHVVFDFDGTVSWLRHGWPEMMAQIFRQHFALKPGETEQLLHDLLLDEILSLNGKPSIHQMDRCAELVRQRGGVPPDPQNLLAQYQKQLNAAVRESTAAILSGRCATDDSLVFGARKMLDALHQRGLTLVILSGSDEQQVKEEARLLDLTRYFGNHIYGSTGAKFSKRAVLDRLLAEERIHGHNLLSFGDGPVEIQHTKELGGLAIAVASDEDVNGSGRVDPQKRKLLLSAGADLVVADYRDSIAVMESVLEKPHE
jgi:phosphoglycolate phosphatase-like HAD superfamily hydrolase